MQNFEEFEKNKASNLVLKIRNPEIYVNRSDFVEILIAEGLRTYQNILT